MKLTYFGKLITHLDLAKIYIEKGKPDSANAHINYVSAMLAKLEHDIVKPALIPEPSLSKQGELSGKQLSEEE